MLWNRTEYLELTDCFFIYVLQVNLLFFAKSRELTAVSEAKIEVPSTVLTGKQLLEEILSAYPAWELIHTDNRVWLNLNQTAGSIYIKFTVQICRKFVTIKFHEIYLPISNDSMFISDLPRLRRTFL